MLAPYWRHLVKGSVQVLLFVILLKYFGLPSWERYQEESTVVTSVEKDLGLIPAPTVTVCPTNPETFLGFKDDSVRLEDFPNSEFVFELCKGLEGEDIVRCVEKKTFGLSEGIHMAKKGFVENFTDPRFWSPEFSLSNSGICYQLETNITLGVKKKTDVLWIVFKTNKSIVSFHDPNFFIIPNSSPGFPLNVLVIGKRMIWYSFKLVQHNNLNLASKRCNPDPLYSFTRCIKTSLSKEVGCKLHWDRWTPQEIPTCQHLEQYRSKLY